MNTLIIKVNPLKIPNFNNYTTFKEEYEKYVRSCKKKYLATPEFFSLKFNTTLYDLKDCVFVRPSSEYEELFIKKNFEILEEI